MKSKPKHPPTTRGRAKVRKTERILRRPIPDFYPYTAGSDGGIWKNGKRLKPAFSRGYPKVTLTNSTTGLRACKAIHSLIITAWKGPYPKGKCCSHEDGDRANSRPNNLYYKTWVENEADKKRHGTALFGERHLLHKLTEKDVKNIRKSSMSKRALGRLYGVTHQSIIAAFNSKTWKHLPLRKLPAPTKARK